MDKDSYYYYNLGNKYFDQKDIKKAINSFQKSLEIEPHFKTYEKLYDCYIKLGNKELADRCIELAYKHNENNDRVAYLYSQTLINRNNLSEAKKILSKMLQRNPSYQKAKQALDEIL